MLNSENEDNSDRQCENSDTSAHFFLWALYIRTIFISIMISSLQWRNKIKERINILAHITYDLIKKIHKTIKLIETIRWKNIHPFFQNQLLQETKNKKSLISWIITTYCLTGWVQQFQSHPPNNKQSTISIRKKNKK